MDDGKDSLISTSVVGEAIVQDSTTDTQLVSDSRLEEPFDETAFFEEDEDDFWADFYVAGEEDTTLLKEELTMFLSM